MIELLHELQAFVYTGVKILVFFIFLYMVLQFVKPEIRLNVFYIILAVPVILIFATGILFSIVYFIYTYWIFLSVVIGIFVFLIALDSVAGCIRDYRKREEKIKQLKAKLNESNTSTTNQQWS